MPMDAWREGEKFVVEFDLPGVNADSLDIDIERNVVTVRAERPAVDPNRRNAGRRAAARSVQPPAGARRKPGHREDRGLPTTKACCACTFRSPRRPSRARSPSTAATGTRRSATAPGSGRSSTPDRPGVGQRGGRDRQEWSRPPLHSRRQDT